MNRPDYDDIVRRSNRLHVELRASLHRRLAQLAGLQLSKILESVDQAAQFLRSDSAELRCAAIDALSLHWRVSPDTDHAKLILDIARRDRDPDVRRHALGALGVIFRETDDVEVGHVLARTVIDDDEVREVRKEAYIGLCFLRAAFKESWAIHSFPEGVDWSFVKRFLEDSRSAEPVDPIDSFSELFPFPIGEKEIELLKIRRDFERNK